MRRSFRDSITEEFISQHSTAHVFKVVGYNECNVTFYEYIVLILAAFVSNGRYEISCGSMRWESIMVIAQEVVSVEVFNNPLLYDIFEEFFSDGTE